MSAAAQLQHSLDDRDVTYPFAVDIVIPPSGFDDGALSLIEVCMFRCRGAVERWSYPLKIDGPVVLEWAARIGFGVAAEADWAASMLKELNAKRMR